jgi:hypothetical protein
MQTKIMLIFLHIVLFHGSVSALECRIRRGNAIVDYKVGC